MEVELVNVWYDYSVVIVGIEICNDVSELFVVQIETSHEVLVPMTMVIVKVLTNGQEVSAFTLIIGSPVLNEIEKVLVNTIKTIIIKETVFLDV